VSRPRRTSPLAQPSLSAALDYQLFAQFLDIYCPSTAPLQSGRERTWFHLVPSIQNPSLVLSYATKAIAASRVAFAYGDANLRLRAFDAYGRALQELQKALFDPNLMYRDDTLAAARSLVTFEVASPVLIYKRRSS
jgi:hypothetical protein